MAGGAVAIAYGLLSTVQAIRRPTSEKSADEGASSLKSALVFAGTLALVLLLAAACRARFEDAGLVLAVGLAGLADAHAAAISAASLVAAGQIGPAEALIPILLGLTTNTLVLVDLAIWAPVVLGLRR